MVVSVWNNDYNCTSNDRRTSTPISTWIAYKTLPIMMFGLNLGPKKECACEQWQHTGVPSNMLFV
jgi:hypothetical protein